MAFRWLLLPVLLALFVSMVHAGPVRIVDDPTRDVRQTMHARKLLADDPDLAAWNIGVTVHDRVATLWGLAPSVEVAFRAELCLRSIIELAEVRNELFVNEALKPMRVPLQIDNPPSFLPGQMPPSLPPLPRSIGPLPRVWPEQNERDPLWPRLFKKAPALMRVD